MEVHTRSFLTVEAVPIIRSKVYVKLVTDILSWNQAHLGHALAPMANHESGVHTRKMASLSQRLLDVLATIARAMDLIPCREQATIALAHLSNASMVVKAMVHG